VTALAAALVGLAALVQATRGPELRGPQPGVTSYPTPAFDRNGKLWLAFNQGAFIYVTSSDDLGRSFGPAVPVNQEPEAIDANGEGRPKIAILDDGTVLVTWTQTLDVPYTGLIRFSRSTDGGKSFSAPVSLNDDGLVTGHRFDALAVTPSGDVLVAWIDKRDLEHALSVGAEYAGAAIYTASSHDGGKTFEPNRKLKDHVCECCRLSFAFDADGEAALLFRDVLDAEIRDHSLAQGVEGPEPPRIHRVTFDDWKINACPHHGPSFWVDGQGTYHIAWFTAGERSGTGVFYSRSTDGGRHFEAPTPVGNTDRGASHPFVLGIGRDVYLAWLEGDGQESAIRLQKSTDGGQSWTSPVTVAKGSPGADHPWLVTNGREVFLSWFAKDSGYRLIPVSQTTSSR
jgi:hypothetical protein